MSYVRSGFAAMTLLAVLMAMGCASGNKPSPVPHASEGRVQGSTLSPLLGNAYLHHVLDL